MKRIAKRVLPSWLYRPVLAAWRRTRRRPLAAGSGLSGLRPLSAIWGLDRGTPIERYYVEQFLAKHAADIRGDVLEMGDPRYTRRFGGDRVRRSEVLHIGPGNPDATLIGDLVTGTGIPRNAFDCFIVVITFFLIYDVRAAIRTCYEALKPGGVLLAHFTGIARRLPDDDHWGPPGWSGEGDLWRFTSVSARRLCAEAFTAESMEVVTYGNVRSAAASLYGLACEDLLPEELNYHDPNFELAICVRAVRPSG